MGNAYRDKDLSEFLKATFCIKNENYFFRKNIQRIFYVYKTLTGLKFLWKQKSLKVAIDLMI